MVPKYLARTEWREREGKEFPPMNTQRQITPSFLLPYAYIQYLCTQITDCLCGRVSRARVCLVPEAYFCYDMNTELDRMYVCCYGTRLPCSLASPAHHKINQAFIIVIIFISYPFLRLHHNDHPSNPYNTHAENR